MGDFPRGDFHRSAKLLVSMPRLACFENGRRTDVMRKHVTKWGDHGHIHGNLMRIFGEYGNIRIGISWEYHGNIHGYHGNIIMALWLWWDNMGYRTKQQATLNDGQLGTRVQTRGHWSLGQSANQMGDFPANHVSFAEGRNNGRI